METSRDRGPAADNPRIDPGYDYEYDEAHDMQAWPLREMPGPHQIDAPSGVHVGEGGDLGYDEAHDSVHGDLPRPEARPVRASFGSH